MSFVDPDRLDLVEAFMANPGGPHGPELQRLVNELRFDKTMNGKYVLVCTQPHREWTLAQLPGERGKPLIWHRDRVFADLDDAERAIFRLRWESRTGKTLD